MAFSYLSLVVIVLSAVTGLVSEGLCWLFVYRTASYQRLKQEVEKANRKVAEASGTFTGGRSRKSKQEQRKDDLMKASAKEIFKIQIKTAFIVRIVSLFLFKCFLFQMGLTLLLFYNVFSQL